MGPGQTLSGAKRKYMTAIPVYPDFSPVSRECRDEVEGVLARMERPISEWSFANLFLFRKAHDYRLSRLGGLLLITATGYDGVRYAFPPWGEGDVEDAARLLMADLSRQGFPPVIYPVPASMYEKYFKGPDWTGTPDRDGADYVYLRENLAELPGSRYHKKRNRLAKYLREAGEAYEYSDLLPEHAEECVRLATGWCDERCDISRPSTYLETAAAVEALTLMGELGLKGGVVKMGGRVVAYCLGETLGPDTFVVHFEKAEPGTDGPAQLINREFCKNGIAGSRFVNREQDLGDPGLRQAKESYHPEYLAEKYKVRPNLKGNGENAG